MFLFILENIGTQELILIGVVALIFLGPRKMPQIAKTISKTLAEFRSATNEFKQTWEREANFDEELKALKFDEEMKAFKLDDEPSKPIARTEPLPDGLTGITAAPEIKEIDKERFDKLRAREGAEAPEEISSVPVVPDTSSDKRNWL